ncbi:MAG: PH domain-containing protein [Woeseiaceae bacterium]|jgi:membrane protein YdbS with pleckstrin-like domain|nr:PH domain-containing protein [Woeseiaceae bacterium]
MSAKRFNSRVDRWLVFVLVATVLVQLIAISAALSASDATPAVLVGIGVLLLTVILFIWLLRSTYYEIRGDTLRIVSGPYRIRIPVEMIESIEPTRSPLSSPALSLDRLRIRYGKKQVLVSPADKRGFLRALGFDAAGRRA